MLTFELLNTRVRVFDVRRGWRPWLVQTISEYPAHGDETIGLHERPRLKKQTSFPSGPLTMSRNS
jgi:hypothetical protein